MWLILFFILLIAKSNPILASDRNIFGLHLTQTSDLKLAKDIINSSGGDWGYATIVIRTDLMDRQMWQEFFNQCRRYHITPIVRLATIMENDYWKKPSLSDIDNLAYFLASLNWPHNQQIIVLFNEPNHASEWSGGVDAKEYADLSMYTINKFKDLNPNFFILSGGLDLAAPQKPPQYESASVFYQQIAQYKPEFFEKIDGLASHSYPNHGFVGLPSESGQHSIRGYIWELNFLGRLGVRNDLPVFITETGWPHREGETFDRSFYTSKTTTDLLITTLNIWQKDTNVQAVTPFIFNYPYPPFDHFSWLQKDETLYPEYQKLIDLPKNQNSIHQTNIFQVIKINLPLVILAGNKYNSSLELKNSGQAIWGENKFCLNPINSANITLSPICFDQTRVVEPGQIIKINFDFQIDASLPQENSFLCWDQLPCFGLSPFTPKSTIYHPTNKFYEKIGTFFRSIFRKTSGSQALPTPSTPGS